jgi:hypothetical protein
VKQTEPFGLEELEELGRFLDRADDVVPMRAVADGEWDSHLVGMRHDVDNAIEPAVAMALWEAERGYQSTYFILHTAPYWHDTDLMRRSLDVIADCGHEIGLHNNAIAEATQTGDDPRLLLAIAANDLRMYGHEVIGTVAHGDPGCYGDDGLVRFVNDEIFEECARPGLGEPDRVVADVNLRPVPLSHFRFEYDANWLPRGAYLSDSGGRWSGVGFDANAMQFPFDGQLHMLVHPDWWVEAFAEVPA